MPLYNIMYELLSETIVLIYILCLQGSNKICNTLKTNGQDCIRFQMCHKLPTYFTTKN